MTKKKIDHIAIAVKNLDDSGKLFKNLLNTEPSKTETIKSEKVKVQFFETKNSKIELLEGIGEKSPITKFIKKRGEGIHHIAFEVEDIYKEIERLKQLGFKTISESISTGANNKLISFLHPKDTNGVLIEICQKKKINGI
tara:strand:- start:773 stop:1192 length:420 start_codon:yes stop_codon:yes gene_type:complete